MVIDLDPKINIGESPIKIGKDYAGFSLKSNLINWKKSIEKKKNLIFKGNPEKPNVKLKGKNPKKEINLAKKCNNFVDNSYKALEKNNPKKARFFYNKLMESCFDLPNQSKRRFHRKIDDLYQKIANKEKQAEKVKADSKTQFFKAIKERGMQVMPKLPSKEAKAIKALQSSGFKGKKPEFIAKTKDIPLHKKEEITNPLKDLFTKKDPSSSTKQVQLKVPIFFNNLKKKLQTNNSKPKSKVIAKGSRLFIRCNQLIEKSYVGLDSNKKNEAKIRYSKARKIYLNLDYEEKKNAYKKLLALYKKLAS